MFAKCRNKLNEIHKVANVDHYINVINSNAHNPSKIWGIVNVITLRINQNIKITVVRSKNEVYKNDFQIASTFNDSFINNATVISKCINILKQCE